MSNPLPDGQFSPEIGDVKISGDGHPTPYAAAAIFIAYAAVFEAALAVGLVVVAYSAVVYETTAWPN